MLLITVTIAKNCRRNPLNRFSRNSGMVKTRDASRNGMKNQMMREKVNTFAHSETATQTP